MSMTSSWKNITRAAAVLAVSGLALTGCGSDNGGDTATGNGDAESYRVGISQYVTHPSLDATREGFKDAFEEAGVEVTFDVHNAAADQANVNTISGRFEQDDEMDLVFAIATPSAITAASTVTDTPIVFGAVTDPVEASLVADWEQPGGNVTGVSDLNPVADQLQMIRDLMPEATTLGIPYSAAEANSAVQVELAKEAAEELGFEIEEVTVTNSSEVQQAANSLSGVDAVWVPTDNVVVSALESVLSFGIDNQIPVFAGEPDSVERGAVGTFGIDYYEQGKQAGEIALDILQNDTDPGTIAVVRAEADTLERTINTTAAEQMGLDISEEELEQATLVE